MWRLNPLQWSFGPRTTATLLTWAVVPSLCSILVMWFSLQAGAQQAGLPSEQFNVLTAGMIRNLLYVTIPLLIICVGAALLFSRVVVKPLWRLRQSMEQVAAGDLTMKALPVASRDEVGQITGSFNQMVVSLQGIVREVAATTGELDAAGRRLQALAGHTAEATEESARQIDRVRSTAATQSDQAAGGSQATGELMQSAEQVAAAADSQAREVERVATTVQEMAGAIQQVAGGAGVVAEAAAHTRSAAEAGGQSVEAVMAGMVRVKDTVLTAGSQVERLADSLHQVDGILQLISEIAEQTDLLALNAAIEAARVGEHGKGFAVVAGEVRRLAERSRRAVEDISERVEALRQGARAVVTTVESGTEEVQVGARLAQEAGASLDRILNAVAETQRQVESISAAAEEIAAASTNVVEATHHLSAIAEENAATAEQMLSSARGVSGAVAAVEEGARSTRESTGSMADAAGRVREAVSETVASATQVSATSARLRDSVARFRLAR